jgi:nicotinamide-nucleotide amidase
MASPAVSALPAGLMAKAEELLQLCLLHGVTLTTAESCTGGLVAASLTAIPGSSRVVERGFVTYSNRAKSEMIGVPEALIDSFGAVSAEVARAMAEGALIQSHADVSLSITGIAGPDGGTPSKPVGTVHIAAAQRGAVTLHRAYHFAGDRDAVREQSTAAAMDLLAERICAFRPSSRPSPRGGEGA